MTDHLIKHRAEMQRQAWPVVERFVQEHPQYTIDSDQTGSASVTNYVIFGQRGDERVVFKYFCQDERNARELFALRHFAETGIVPKLLEKEGQRLIVVSWIPGAGLPDPDTESLDAPARALSGHSLGAAAAKLVCTPLSASALNNFQSCFYDGESLHDYLQRILQASWAIHKTISCYGGSIFAQSLASIEANLDHILSQPRLLYHQDAMNVHFLENRCSGFFDLEMCRVGTAPMQIGSLWWMIATYQLWDSFAQGFAEVTGSALTAQDMAASRAFAHFLVWRYISDYGDWRGEPLSEEAMVAEIEKAANYRRELELFNTVME